MSFCFCPCKNDVIRFAHNDVFAYAKMMLLAFVFACAKNDVIRFAHNDVFRFAQNDVSLCDMMYLLRKYDVASLRAAMMKYPPFAAGKHH